MRRALSVKGEQVFVAVWADKLPIPVFQMSRKATFLRLLLGSELLS